MLSKELLMEWLNALPDDAELAIHDDDLVSVGTGERIEVGYGLFGEEKQQ